MFSLKNKSDVRTIAFLGLKYAWVATHWTLFPYLGIWNCLFTLFGFLPAFVTCCITHNCMHCDTFQNNNVETVFRGLLSIGLGHPVQLYKPTHNHNHHIHTQTSEDHSRTDIVQYTNHTMNLLAYFFHILPAVQKLEHQYVAEQFRKRSPTFYRIAIQAFFLFGTWAILLRMDWKRWLCCVYIPTFMGVYGILSMNMMQHDGCKISESASGKNMDPNSARNFVSPILNYITLNNGYHSIHHMYPSMHWSLLKKKHDELIKPHIDPKLDEPSLIGYIFKTFFWPGRLPDYRKYYTKLQ